jgi:cytochrome P450
MLLNTLPSDELGRTNRLAFLDLMIEQRGSELHSLRDKDMRDEAFTLIVAGHETTANSNCFILTLIGLHDHVQDEIARELDLIFADNPDRHASYHDLQNMTYLEMVIYFSLCSSQLTLSTQPTMFLTDKTAL